MLSRTFQPLHGDGGEGSIMSVSAVEGNGLGESYLSFCYSV